MKISPFFKILFICFVVLGIYYPSIFSTFNTIDDSHIVSYLEDTQFNLLDVIIPGRSHYYRPVVWLTLFFDKFAWGIEPSFMHIENILFHLINSLLIYLIADNISGDVEKNIELPLLSALLFASHPINTEAVCWVAGRTDSLATIFLLLSTLLLIKGKDFLILYMAAALIFLGCLAKEVAFFYFPIAALIALVSQPFLEIKKLPGYKLKHFLRVTLPFIFFSLVYLYLRQLALKQSDTSVSAMVIHTSSFIHSAILAITAFGFYVKKLFLPLPLNFAIISYSSHYLWVGLAFLPILCWLLLQKRACYQYLGASLFLIAPALIVAVRPIAWTPVAERYLYAPSAFFAISITGILCICLKKANSIHILPLILVIVIALSSYFTVTRAIVWQDNYLLYKDSVDKSPGFGRLRNELGIAAAARGDLAEATHQFTLGSDIDNSFKLPAMNLANLKFKNGEKEEALKILDKAYHDKKDAKVDVLKLRARIYESMFFEKTPPSEQRKNVTKLIDTYREIYILTKDSYLAYRAGQIMLFADKKNEAAIMFKHAYRSAPPDAFYKQAAKKLADKLDEK